jgi:hypothetical protein
LTKALLHQDHKYGFKFVAELKRHSRAEFSKVIPKHSRHKEFNGTTVAAQTENYFGHCEN